MKQKTQAQRRKEIIRSYAKGNYALTIELAESFLSDFPNFATALFFYGVSLGIFHRHSEALAALSTSAKYSVDEILHHNYCARAKVYEDKGDYKNAARWYQKAHEKYPQEATYPIFLGVLQFKMGDISSAETTLRKATKCREGFTDEAFYNLGNVMAAQKKYKQAINCYEKALAIDPKYMVAKRMLKEMQLILEMSAKNKLIKF
jgi:tetratricopeptide (TPR) repeat protein